MNQRKLPKAGSQRRIILDELIKAKGEYVGLNVLMREACCGAVHSQVAELRSKYDADIRNRQVSDGGGKHSSYLLHNYQEFQQGGEL